MPASRGATIEIRLNEVSHNKNNRTGSNIGAEESNNETSFFLQERNLATAYMVNAINTEIQTVVDYGLTQFHIWMQLSDNIEMQRNITNARNIVSKGISISNSLSVGLASAGIPGLVVAGIVSATSLAKDILLNYQQQQIQIDTMQTQLNFSRERSGYSLTSGGR